jgi:hypothetical protein
MTPTQNALTTESTPIFRKRNLVKKRVKARNCVKSSQCSRAQGTES